MCNVCKALLNMSASVHLSQGTLQRCLVGPPCTASHLGGGMGMQMMRTPSNRKASHPAKNMTAPFQVGGILILDFHLEYHHTHYLHCNSNMQCLE